jgi:hypothetical protein
MVAHELASSDGFGAENATKELAVVMALVFGSLLVVRARGGALRALFS